VDFHVRPQSVFAVPVNGSFAPASLVACRFARNVHPLTREFADRSIVNFTDYLIYRPGSWSTRAKRAAANTENV
jgi:hypothetical protein